MKNGAVQILGSKSKKPLNKISLTLAGKTLACNRLPNGLH